MVIKNLCDEERADTKRENNLKVYDIAFSSKSMGRTKIFLCELLADHIFRESLMIFP